MGESEGYRGDVLVDQGGGFRGAGHDARRNAELSEDVPAAPDEGMVDLNASGGAAGKNVEGDFRARLGFGFGDDIGDVFADLLDLVGIFAADFEFEDGFAGDAVVGGAGFKGAEDDVGGGLAGKGDGCDLADDFIDGHYGASGSVAGPVVFGGDFAGDVAAEHAERGVAEASERGAFEADAEVDGVAGVLEEVADALEVSASGAAGGGEEDKVGAEFEAKAVEKDGEGGEDADAEAVADAASGDFIGGNGDGVVEIVIVDGVGAGGEKDVLVAGGSGDDADAVADIVDRAILDPGFNEAVDEFVDAVSLLEGG